MARTKQEALKIRRELLLRKLREELRDEPQTIQTKQTRRTQTARRPVMGKAPRRSHANKKAPRKTGKTSDTSPKNSPRNSPKKIPEVTYSRSQLQKMPVEEVRDIYFERFHNTNRVNKPIMIDAIAGPATRKIGTRKTDSNSPKSPKQQIHSRSSSPTRLDKDLYSKCVECSVSSSGKISDCLDTGKSVQSTVVKNRISGTKNVPKKFHGKQIQCDVGALGGIYNCTAIN
jgi:hypothetical protein